MQRDPASFRDPSGFIFRSHGVLLRQVNESYREDYDALLGSGLYDELVARGRLVAHREVPIVREDASDDGARAWKWLRPDVIPFVSQPYEWCFGQLKAAALATLEIQLLALEKGMTLKDASAYNIQFIGARPLCIDTLSFVRRDAGAPWIAYRQFCQHFLAPLALMAHRDLRLGQLSRLYIDGVPLDLASGLLPARTRLKFGLATHLHLHARYQERHGDDARGGGSAAKPREISERGALGLLDSLRSAVEALKLPDSVTPWGDYYQDTNYSERAFAHKRELLVAFLEREAPERVIDLGANTGEFSRLASERGAYTIASDVDPLAVERAYARAAVEGDELLHPLLVDLRNPSPAQGWAHAERASLEARGPFDVALALALVHHLAIGNNVPLAKIAAWFARIARALVIEFVPKTDSQVERLLATREDIFDDYGREGFERAFSRYFTICESEDVDDSKRTLFRMQRKES